MYKVGPAVTAKHNMEIFTSMLNILCCSLSDSINKTKLPLVFVFVEHVMF